MAKQIETIVHTHEPDVEVSEYIEETVSAENHDKGDDDDGRKMTIRLISSAVIYALYYYALSGRSYFTDCSMYARFD